MKLATEQKRKKREEQKREIHRRRTILTSQENVIELTTKYTNTELDIRLMVGIRWFNISMTVTNTIQKLKTIQLFQTAWDELSGGSFSGDYTEYKTASEIIGKQEDTIKEQERTLKAMREDLEAADDEADKNSLQTEINELEKTIKELRTSKRSDVSKLNTMTTWEVLGEKYVFLIIKVIKTYPEFFNCQKKRIKLHSDEELIKWFEYKNIFVPGEATSQLQKWVKEFMQGCLWALKSQERGGELFKIMQRDFKNGKISKNRAFKTWYINNSRDELLQLYTLDLDNKESAHRTFMNKYLRKFYEGKSSWGTNGCF